MTSTQPETPEPVVPEEQHERLGVLEESEPDHRGRILVVYAAREAHAAVIVDALATRLRRHGFCVEVGDASLGAMPPPQDYDVVVLGSQMGFDHEAAVI